MWQVGSEHRGVVITDRAVQHERRRPQAPVAHGLQQCPDLACWTTGLGLRGSAGARQGRHTSSARPVAESGAALAACTSLRKDVAGRLGSRAAVSDNMPQQGCAGGKLRWDGRGVVPQDARRVRQACKKCTRAS